MTLSAEAPRKIAALADSLRVPAGWDVRTETRLAGGWLGPLDTSLAVLAPGPPTAVIHRAQLVAFMVGAGGGAARSTALGQVALAAAAEIPEAWLIDAEQGWTEVFRAPYDGRYRSRRLCYAGESIRLLALSRLEVMPLPR